jgi:hypothetical protein
VALKVVADTFLMLLGHSPGFLHENEPESGKQTGRPARGPEPHRRSCPREGQGWGDGVYRQYVRCTSVLPQYPPPGVPQSRLVPLGFACGPQGRLPSLPSLPPGQAIRVRNLKRYNVRGPTGEADRERHSGKEEWAPKILDLPKS